VNSSDDPTHNRPVPVKEAGQGGPNPSGAARAGGVSAPGAGNQERLDREVLEAVRRRDPEALSRFFEVYFMTVYGTAYRLLGNRDAAEDITQEVFYKVHRAAHQLDPERDPAAWLAGITTNACRDLWRSRAHRMGKESSSLDDNPVVAARLASPGPDPEQDADRGEREALVQAALQELPDPMREVVVLHDYQGLTHDEIASMTGATHAAIRKRYSRALDRLGEILKERLT